MNLDIKTKLYLISVKRKLVESMEQINLISEDDFRKIVLASSKRKAYLKNIMDNVERGNLFMIVFFVRELIESILNEE